MNDYSTPPELNPVDLWYQTGKTQQELAELLGVHTVTFARWSPLETCTGKSASYLPPSVQYAPFVCISLPL